MTSPFVETNKGRGIRTVEEVLEDRNKCPRCGSPRPELHPAMQFEGEVQPCKHVYHGTGKREEAE